MPIEELSWIFSQKIKKMRGELQEAIREDENKKMREIRQLNRSVAGWLSND